jgi:hypothetical protein
METYIRGNEKGNKNLTRNIEPLSALVSMGWFVFWGGGGGAGGERLASTATNLRQMQNYGQNSKPPLKRGTAAECAHTESAFI